MAKSARYIVGDHCCCCCRRFRNCGICSGATDSAWQKSSRSSAVSTTSRYVRSDACWNENNWRTGCASERNPKISSSNTSRCTKLPGISAISPRKARCRGGVSIANAVSLACKITAVGLNNAKERSCNVSSLPFHRKGTQTVVSVALNNFPISSRCRTYR